MSNIVLSQAGKLAEKLNLAGDPRELVDTLKATAFKGDVSDAQMAALLIVSNQYGLSPWTREIFAFPDKQNGIVPVVGVDGWSRIINQHPQFDGMDFDQSETMVELEGAKPAPEWMECRIYRKDRTHPTVAREYLDEVYRPPFNGKYGKVNGPWQSHTKRFLRHKTMIQCARMAFGYAGIYDQDEAERIVEATESKHMGPAEVVPPAPPAHYPDEAFEKNVDAWAKTILSGKMTEERLVAMVSAKGALTEEQRAELRNRVMDLMPPPPADVIDAETGELIEEGEQA